MFIKNKIMVSLKKNIIKLKFRKWGNWLKLKKLSLPTVVREVKGSPSSSVKRKNKPWHSLNYTPKLSLPTVVREVKRQ